MQESETKKLGGTEISMSYLVNGGLVKTSVNNISNSRVGYHQLSCEKTSGGYALDFLSSSGEFTFLFYTDSLHVKTYVHKGFNGGAFFLSYSNASYTINGYAQYPSDSVSVTISQYNNKRINGTFSGRLTPSIIGGPTGAFGTSGSILITNGSFENVPVFQ